ncbi:MAG TPA: hypothetical protein VFZ32_17550 [Micromonosporaceae bacterium]
MSAQFSRIGILLSVLFAMVLISAGPAQAQTTPGLGIDRTGAFDALTGNATVTGTYACGDLSGSGLIEVTLGQDVGRVATVSGYGFSDLACEPGQTGTWYAEIVPTTGEYRGGPAFASARLTVGDQGTETGRQIQLSRAG